MGGERQGNLSCEEVLIEAYPDRMTYSSMLFIQLYAG